MVSFQAPLSPTQRDTINIRDTEDEFYKLEMINSTKKRKREIPDTQVEGIFEKSMFDREIHFETPLPLEWQRCLDIKSGELYYLNTRTQQRTTKDPRTSLEPSHHMSLDLELNLPCGSFSQNFTKNNTIFPSSSSKKASKNTPFSNIYFENRNINTTQELTLFPPRSGLLEDDNDDDKREMITAVCKKCHMLVMMCKSSPSCPNCKFMHPLDQKTHVLFKQNLSLLC